MIIHHQLAANVLQAIAAAQTTGELPDTAVQSAIERPRDPTHGDYATSISLKLAKPARLASENCRCPAKPSTFA